MPTQHVAFLLSILFVTATLGCQEPAEPGSNGNDKEDTGYLSDRAVEVEAQFIAELEIDLANQDYMEERYMGLHEILQAIPPERFLEILEGVRDGKIVNPDLDAEYGDEDPTDEDYEEIRVLFVVKQWIEQQIALANRQIVAQSIFHPSLQDGDVSIREVSLAGTTIRLSYVTTLEMLALKDTLSEQGLTAEDIESQEATARVLPDPTKLFDRFNDTCASDVEGELQNSNYFYYFDVGACPARMVDAVLKVNKLLPEEESYPEYDRLVDDGELTVVMFHGVYEAAEERDIGVREWKQFGEWLRDPDNDFTYVGPVIEAGAGAPFDIGERWTRTRKTIDGSDLTVVVDSISPYDQANVDDAGSLFSFLFSKHEIVVFNGHSGYGSRRMLHNPETYRPNIYQIVFMNSCWSYEYYTKQIIRHKRTEDDPVGWKDVDIVNNSEAGSSYQRHEISSLFLSRLLAGAESGGLDRERDYHYSWQNILTELNNLGTIGQVYGASAVRGNEFRPNAN